MEENTLKNMVYGNTVYGNTGEGIRSAMDDTPRIYHVSPFGDDTRDGLSWMSSFRTTTKGLSVLRVGDTLRICEGTYSEVVKK